MLYCTSKSTNDLNINQICGCTTWFRSITIFCETHSIPRFCDWEIFLCIHVLAICMVAYRALIMLHVTWTRLFGCLTWPKDSSRSKLSKWLSIFRSRLVIRIVSGEEPCRRSSRRQLHTWCLELTPQTQAISADACNYDHYTNSRFIWQQKLSSSFSRSFLLVDRSEHMYSCTKW